MAGGVKQGGGDVFGFKERVIREDFLTARTVRDQVKNVTDPQAEASDARPSATFPGFDSDSVEDIHSGRLRLGRMQRNHQVDTI